MSNIRPVSSEHTAMKIRKANEADLGTIQNLLNANDLPVEDVSTTLIEGFLVAEDARGTVVGSGGLEQLGSSVLLRSLAITPEWRGTGVARKLVELLEDNARSLGQQEVWLLITTAERFFARAGYELASRDDVPSEVRLCRQFAVLCPSTAMCMRKRL
ncbi:GNAT family N-acetyltransferase [Paraburkholderia madseniana]|uniref:GNAT family N-acetyltransferase n=1 Tax=Paraburkholderia madseniana TaxID=2599607 RepID=A0A6N6WMK1_9BURK|nr:arsenic resistance N-acetyltransferase ArsN2 [Paraburkholderia madseniana]KAE8761279.1 GNAT family N-acetyltransferase [Paraburkholderia madseniana]